jgi:hypothetical protein
MSDLVIRIRDAYREPLEDVADVILGSPGSSAVVRQRKNHPATKILKLTGLTPLEPYLLRVFPVRHRPVGQFVRAPADASETIEVFCPVDPGRVTSVTFPAYDALPPAARAVLQVSAVESFPGLDGPALYEALPNLPKAGLLNLVAKMARTGLPGGSTVLDQLDSLYRVRPDRVFANVKIGLRDLVITGLGDHSFRPVSGSLHTPDPEFKVVDSYKTFDPYGNLQLTFFSSLAAPLRFRADIDIDDAAGIAHVFQVLGHAITGGDTHPYDIHEILVFHQRLDPGYRLNT